MQDTVKSLLESSVAPDVDFYTHNTTALNMLDTITEAELMNTRYTAQKVMVLKSPDSGYLVEYANNLDRFMVDNDMGIAEAMQVVADINEIPIEECTVVFDDSCIDKINIEAVIKLDPKFDIKRK